MSYEEGVKYVEDDGQVALGGVANCVEYPGHGGIRDVFAALELPLSEGSGSWVSFCVRARRSY